MIIRKDLSNQILEKSRKGLLNIESNGFEENQKHFSIYVANSNEIKTLNEMKCEKNDLNGMIESEELIMFIMKQEEEIIACGYVINIDYHTKKILGKDILNDVVVDKREKTALLYFNILRSHEEKKIENKFTKFIIEYCQYVTNLQKLIKVIQSEIFNEQDNYEDIHEYLKRTYTVDKQTDMDIEYYRNRGWKVKKVLFNYFREKKNSYGLLIEYELNNFCSEEQEDKLIEISNNKFTKAAEIVPLSVTDTKKPLIILIHPLSGDVGIYRKLARLLAKEMNVIAIRSRGLEPQEIPFEDVQSMAENYLDSILKKYPNFTYNLFGFSFGGLIAYEMSLKMEKQGLKLDNLFMLEAPLTKTQKEKEAFSMKEKELLIMNANFLLFKTLKKNVKKKKIQVSNQTYLSTNELIAYLVNQIYSKNTSISKNTIREKLMCMSRVHEKNLKSLRDYTPDSKENTSYSNKYHLMSKRKNAISQNLLNPDYLVSIQNGMNGLGDFFDNWNFYTSDIERYHINSNSHMDIFDEDLSVKELKGFILSKSVCVNKGLGNNSASENQEIAIIGISGKFPGANSTGEFWRNLKNKKISLSNFPENRNFKIEDYYDPEIKKKNKTYLKKGGFLNNIEDFDSLFFNISPKEAKYMDPSERIFLEESWKAIENAGYNPLDLPSKNWGVFSCAKGDHSVEILKEDPTYFMPTSSNANGRLSYFLNLEGPSMNIDTACSSGLTAVSIACDNILLNNCDYAIVGGGGINSSLNTIISSSQSLLFSPTNSCAPFSQSADGTIIGESICSIVLKNKNKAAEDGDYIYGVIKGWGINQDGKTNGLTAPSGKAQYFLREKVLDKYNIDPKDITYIETHGTGTSLGDQIEFNSLKETFEKYTSEKNFCYLGSVKSNIGHTFFSSGLVSVIKMVLAFKNNLLPPQANLDKVHDNLKIKDSPFQFLDEPAEWKGKRLCAINSFGATGTNAHVIIESYEENFSYEDKTNSHYAIPVSAENKESLNSNIRRLLDFIENIKDNHILSNLAYTLQTGRKGMKHKEGFLTSDLKDLKKQLNDYLNGNTILHTTIDSDDYSIKQKEYLDKWLNGDIVSWEDLYKNKISKLPLPTYDFHPDSVSKVNSLEKHFENLYFYQEFWKLEESDLKNVSNNSYKVFFVESNEEINLFNKYIDKMDNSLALKKSQTVFENFNHYLSSIFSKDVYPLEIFYCVDFTNTDFKEESRNIINILRANNSEKSKLILIGVVNNKNDMANFDALIGFQRSLNTTFNIKTIMFERNGSNKKVEWSMGDLDHIFENINSKQRNIKYLNNKRHTLGFEEKDVTPHENVFREKGTYVLVGGFGGVGKMLSKHLSQNYKANVIIVGKRKLNQDIEKNIDVLNSYGGKSYYYSSDVTNDNNFLNTLKQIENEFPDIRGVFNLAGIANKDNVFKKNIDEFYRTIDVKKNSLENINIFFKDKDVDFICNFSSTSAILGDFGVVDYSIANRILGRENNNKNITIQWPLWENGGMGLGKDQNKMYLEKTGQKLLKESEGMKVLESILYNGTNNIAVFSGDKKSISRLIENSYNHSSKIIKNKDNAISSNKQDSFLGEDKSEYIKNLVRDTQEIDKVIDLDDTLLELGIDSINIFDIVKHINNELQTQLEPSELIELKTIRDIVTKVTSHNKKDYSKTNTLIKEKVKYIISELLLLPLDTIKENNDLFSLGIDSINMFDITNEINKAFKLKLEYSELIGLQNINEISNYLYQNIILQSPKLDEVESPNSITLSNWQSYQREVDDLFKGGYTFENILEDIEGAN